MHGAIREQRAMEVRWAALGLGNNLQPNCMSWFLALLGSHLILPLQLLSRMPIIINFSFPWCSISYFSSSTIYRYNNRSNIVMVITPNSMSWKKIMFKKNYFQIIDHAGGIALPTLFLLSNMIILYIYTEEPRTFVLRRK